VSDDSGEPQFPCALLGTTSAGADQRLSLSVGVGYLSVGFFLVLVRIFVCLPFFFPGCCCLVCLRCVVLVLLFFIVLKLQCRSCLRVDSSVRWR
jgi:hypothetical protein